MRRILIAALLAGAAASPALAQDRHDQDGRAHHNRQPDNDGDDQAQAPRGNGHVDRSDGDGSNPPQAPQLVHQPPIIVQQQGQSGGFDRPRFEGRPDVAPQFVHQPPVIVQQQGQSGGFGRPHYPGRPNVAPEGDGQQAYRGYRGGGFDRPGFEGRGNVTPQTDVQQPTYVYRGRRGGYNGGERDDVDQSRDGRRNDVRNNWNGQNGYFGRNQVVQPQVRDQNRWASSGWNRDWRNDQRYDWRRYRDHHRSIFHIGIYYDPFGYGYQPLGIGYRMIPAYYGPQYWINDPWDYQLPPPPAGTVWVRYWNDALLIDRYTGEVVDSIQDFFW
jgi:Ni/Co efflux regulator RcnB